jgi:two-component system, LytTR family, response regulator
MDKPVKINCIIADDEPLARVVLEKYVALIPHLHLVKSCQNAFEVLETIREHEKIDILFLDIKMPELTGLQLIGSLEHKPKVIMTTAYSEFAIDAYDLGVEDYLMKPIAFDRFVKAVNRVTEVSKSDVVNDVTTDKTENFIFFKSDRTFHKVFLKDIIYIEAYGNFIKVKTLKNTLIVADKISGIEQKLDSSKFMRVHKSYIVATQHIEKITGNTIYTTDGTVQIGESYRGLFLDWVGKS